MEKRELSSIVLTRRAELDLRYWKESGNQIKIDRIERNVLVILSLRFHYEK